MLKKELVEKIEKMEEFHTMHMDLIEQLSKCDNWAKCIEIMEKEVNRYNHETDLAYALSHVPSKCEPKVSEPKKVAPRKKSAKKVEKVSAPSVVEPSVSVVEPSQEPKLPSWLFQDKIDTFFVDLKWDSVNFKDTFTFMSFGKMSRVCKQGIMQFLLDNGAKSYCVKKGNVTFTGYGFFNKSKAELDRKSVV